eukprot:4711412-Pleurochrysis_carterae.AAC.1
MCNMETAIGALGFQHPPVLGTEHSILTRDVHNDVAQRKEQTRGQWLREEVSEIVLVAHEGDRELKLLDLFSQKEVPAMDVLGPRVVLRVVRKVDCRLIVEVQGSRAIVGLTEFVQEGTGLGRRDNLCFARGKRDGGLLFAAARDCRLAVHEHVAGRGVTGRPVRVGKADEREVVGSGVSQPDRAVARQVV